MSSQKFSLFSIAGRFQSTRSQIITSFFGIVAITMLSASAIAYPLLSQNIKETTESYVQESNLLASNNLDAKLSEIDETFQRITLDTEVQSLLSSALKGKYASTDRRLSMQDVLNRQLIFTDLVSSAELYDMKGQALYPLYNQKLGERIGDEVVLNATVDPNRTIWIRPWDEEDGLVAVRHVRLLEDWMAGGYLLFHINQNIFQNQAATQNQNDFVYLVYDEKGELLNDTSGLPKAKLSDFREEERSKWQGDFYYPMIHTSAETGWTMVSLVPAAKIERPVQLLRSVLLVSGAIGVGTALVLSIVLSLLITRPLNHVRRVMKYSQRGEFQANEVIYFNREVNELNRTYNKMVDRIQFLINEVYEKERLTNISKIKALQAQINPHFLFNTLEALNWQLRNKDDDESADLIVSLSDLFRYTSGRSFKSDSAFLTEELQHVERYLKLMQLRLQERLEYSIEVETGIGGYRVPRLLLQPIVENAVYHGAEVRNETSRISVHVRSLDDILQIVVWNSGPVIPSERLKEIREHLDGPEAATEGDIGMGLSNVHERIKLMYGHEYGLLLDSDPSNGTQVTLKLPYYRKEVSE
ncbi:cache domain-containing sensor histidine kinase [Paenibacillus sp. GM2]|uniref:cache domain-containing sensor histidine kinase n=1 Tax=Paenibacillus sp. GM2 TaxID=1622070 RepID=UPI000838BDC3|nr:histidine kinase [Paenibacillus sp. GM2]